jgi:hypothetical protein
MPGKPSDDVRRAEMPVLEQDQGTASPRPITRLISDSRAIALVMAPLVLVLLLPATILTARVVKPFLASIGSSTERVLSGAVQIVWLLTLFVVPVAMWFPRHRRLSSVRRAAIWGAYIFVVLWIFAFVGW